MQFKSRKPKPETGLEMSVTFMMPADQSLDQSREAICKFFETVTAASSEVGSIWLHLHCTNVPLELEGALQTALDQSKRRPNLELVINNSRKDTSNANQ